MKNTGIVRRIDDLGRVVIPKEIRRKLRIREGDPLEIYTDNGGEVIFKKHSLLGEITPVAGLYAGVLSRESGHTVVVCDREKVIAAAGVPKGELVGRRISDALESRVDGRRPFASTADSPENIMPIEGAEYYAVAGAPIIVSGDVYGSILFLSAGADASAGETDVKLISVAAGFICSTMEV